MTQAARMPRAYVGMGGNLGQPERTFRWALDELARRTHVRRRARLYGSAPWGPPGQPDYLNTVVELDTDRDPEVLLDALKAIERDSGRTSTVHWGPRILDLDLLSYDEEIVQTERLQLPHPGIAERPFVLAPWADLSPELVLPGTEHTIRSLWSRLEPPPGSLWVVEDVVLHYVAS